MHVSYMIHWALVEFLILQFTPIPLVYLPIEKNDKIPHVNVHRVKYEQFQNLINKIHFLQISIFKGSNLGMIFFKRNRSNIQEIRRSIYIFLRIFVNATFIHIPHHCILFCVLIEHDN